MSDKLEDKVEIGEGHVQKANVIFKELLPMLAEASEKSENGKPQIWYLDLFAGKNDHKAVKRAGAGGHKEIDIRQSLRLI